MIGAVVGPTASGKSAVAMALARPGVEIVSVDSMQVYRGMDIGTAKPSAADRARVPHHMIDIVDPAEPFSAAAFQRRGREALAAIAGPPLVVGGSGLHLRSLIDPLEFPPTDPDTRRELEEQEDRALVERLLAADPDAAAVVDLANRRRVVRALEVTLLTGDTPSMRQGTPAARAVAAYESIDAVAIVGIDPGDHLDERITSRVDEMLAAGWQQEAASLRGRLGPTAAAAVGYRELIDVADGALDPAEARRTIIAHTRALAKRQRTFFRRDPRVRWLPWHDDPDARVTAARSALEEAQWSS